MIDKSIRQYYENGKEVGPVTKGMKMIWDPIKQKYFPQDETGLDERQLLKNVAGSAVKNIATRKLATQLGGTGILSSLGPIGMIIAMMLARKGIGKGQEYLTQKLTKGGVEQAFQAGFGSPEEQRELRQLEKRRANMLKRKADPNKDYSERNLDIVTRAIAEAKGLDINNPNEMRNIDKPITQIRTERSITEPPRIIPETPEVKSPFAKPIPKTPEVIIPHLEGDRTIPTPTTVTRDIGLGDAGIAERIAAENRAAATQAAAIKAENDRQQREADAAAAAAARARVSVPVPAHISGGGGQNGGQRGSPPTGTAGRNPWGRAYGGRIDKALGGRSRDIG